MKLVLAGGYDTQNLGDYAMLEVFLRDLRSLDSQLDLALLSRHPDNSFDTQFKIRSIVNLDHRSKKESLGRWFNGLNYKDDTTHLKNIINVLQNADMLIIGGGRLFIDITLGFMRGPLSYYGLLITIAKFLQIPVMLFAKTIVQNKTDLGTEHLKYIVSNSDIITVREDESKNNLTFIGIEPQRIEVIPDPAYGLGFSNVKKHGLELLASEGIFIDGSHPVIGANFRFTTLYTKLQDEVFHTLAQLCDRLIHTLDADILLISQGTYGVDNPLDDDRELYQLLKNRSTRPNRLHIIKKRYTINETLAVYQTCDMVYSMRRHGIIFAATQHVPVFCLSGEVNALHPMRQLGISQHALSIHSFHEKDPLDMMLDAYHQRKNITETIEKNLPNLSAQTKKYAETLMSFLKK